MRECCSSNARVLRIIRSNNYHDLVGIPERYNLQEV